MGPGTTAAQGNGSTTMTRKLSNVSLKNSWRLKHQDFVPAKTGNSWNDSEPFQKLLDRANDWLSRNEDVQLKTCETITWMSHEQRWLGDIDQMVLSKSIAEGKDNHFLRGLRLWLIPAAPAASGASVSTRSTIWQTDIVPEGKELISDLVEKINRKLRTRQLKGRIVTVETVAVPIVKDRLQLTVTRWSESVDVDSSYAFVLRVFTDREAPTRLYGSDNFVVGIRDVVPSPTEFGGFESFEVLIEKTNDWLKDQSDVAIINMQSLMVQRNDGPLSSMGSTCFYSMPGINSPEPTEFFRILRVVHIRILGYDRTVDLPILFPFTYETFTPELVRISQKDQSASSQRERLEKMKETFSKVIAFLRNSGADVICSETVMNPMQMYIEETDPPSDAREEDNIRFLFTIRLFLTGQINHLIDGSIRMIKRASIQPIAPPPPPETSDLLPSSDKVDSDQDARAPLFLRHVVGGQFKYRWVILALSAFTCMTIIVVLSVVYSNR